MQVNIIMEHVIQTLAVTTDLTLKELHGSCGGGICQKQYRISDLCHFVHELNRFFSYDIGSGPALLTNCLMLPQYVTLFMNQAART